MNTTCQECGQDCHVFEVLETEVINDNLKREKEVWCWCEDCLIDTFHPFNHTEKPGD